MTKKTYTFKTDSVNCPPIVSFLAGRGGTGKTTVAVNFAALIAEGGKNVLLVDMDLSGQGATYLLQTKGKSFNDSTSLIDVLNQTEEKNENNLNNDIWANGLNINEPKLLQNFQTSKIKGALFFVPARTGGLDRLDKSIGEYSATSQDDICKAMYTFLCKCSENLNLDCIIIDGPGTSDNFAIAAAKLSKYCVLVTQPDRVSRQASRDLEGHIHRSIDKKHMPNSTLWMGQQAKLKVSWIINKITSNYKIENLHLIFDEIDVLTYIPWEEKIAAAYGEISFIRDLGLSGFEIKLQVASKNLLYREDSDLIPDPIKMLPESTLHQYKENLNRSRSTVRKILTYISTISFILGFGILMIIVLKVSGLWEDKKAVVNSQSGNIEYVLNTDPSSSRIMIYLLFLFALVGTLAVVVLRINEKNKSKIDPNSEKLIREIRDMLLSKDKEQLADISA